VLCVLLAGALLALALPAAGSAAPRCTIVGTNGPDTLRGGPGPDVICGRGGADQIAGGGGADRLLGGPGNDRLLGGRGADVLIGGRGRDTCRDAATSIFRGCERRGGKSSPNRPGTRRLAIPPRSYQPPGLQRPADEQAPRRVYLSFESRLVDTSLGDAAINLFVEAWDESGIGAISIDIHGPGGPWRQLQLQGEAGTSTSMQVPVAVPAATPRGEYRVASVTIADQAGNARTLSPAELEAEYLADFVVFAGPDTEPPELTGIQFSSTEVDTSLAPAVVNLAVGASDEGSGIHDVIVTLRMPDWKPGPIGDATYAKGGEQRPSAGSRFDGVWNKRLSLVRHAMPGYYGISAIHINDMAGNHVRYTRAELEELGYPVEVLQAGPGDTTPPEVVDFWFGPNVLNTAAGQRTIHFYVHVRDDLTGFGQWPDEGLSDIHVSFQPATPGWGSFGASGRVAELVSGTEMDGVWHQESELEANTHTGQWNISSIGATDRAGNDLLLKRADVLANQWPDHFFNQP